MQTNLFQDSVELDASWCHAVHGNLLDDNCIFPMASTWNIVGFEHRLAGLHDDRFDVFQSFERIENEFPVRSCRKYSNICISWSLFHARSKTCLFKNRIKLSLLKITSELTFEFCREVFPHPVLKHFRLEPFVDFCRIFARKGSKFCIFIVTRLQYSVIHISIRHRWEL